MKLKQVVAGAAIGCTLGVTGITLGSGVASAAPGCMPPAQCGPGGPAVPAVRADLRRRADPAVTAVRADLRRRADPAVRRSGGLRPVDFRGPGGPGGPPGDFRGPGGPGDFRGPDAHDWRPPWNPGDNDWRGRFHGAPWGDGPAPWGWGAPPPPPWDGPLPEAWGPPPPPINYWGFNEQPVWDQGYNQWGFYFFGIWIPLPI